MTPEQKSRIQEWMLSGEASGPVVNAGDPAWMQFLQAHRVEIVALVACVTLMTLVFELVRRNAIKEKYSFLWFLTGISLTSLTLKRDWLTGLARTLGVYYPPTALFLVLGFFVIVMLVHYSMVLSRLLTQNQKLAQKVALLEAKLDERELKKEDAKTDADEAA